MVKDIDYEINRLLKIKEEVAVINYMKKLDMTLEFVSETRYNKLSFANKLDNDTVYYVVDAEIGQYIEGYIQ